MVDINTITDSRQRDLEYCFVYADFGCNIINNYLNEL